MSVIGLPIAFAVPPVNLLGLSLLGLLVARRWRRLGGLLISAGLIGLLLLGTPWISGLLIQSLEQDLPVTPDPNDPPQAIVILSGNITLSAGGLWIPGWLTLERERAGAALARRTGLPILVTGGMVEHSNETLAGAMVRSMAEDFRTQVRWVEPHALDTWQNASESAAILRADNIHTIYLVTHPWHMRRALIAFARTGLRVVAAPAVRDRPPLFEFSEFIPTTDAWQDSYYALHEWIGCAYYALLRDREE
jgi:uncharacterized SAM-binding protein YcdF (DUF218 family)